VNDATWQQKLPPYLRARLPARAHHEAGHAVIAHLHGFTVTSITILPHVGGWFPHPTPGDYVFSPEHSTGGAVWIDEYETSPARNRGSLKRFLMHLFAGRLAQLKFDPASDVSGSAHDLAVIERLCQRVFRYPAEPPSAAAKAFHESLMNDLRAWRAAVEKETRSLLDREDVWAAVQSCAALLLERGTVPGEEMIEDLPEVLTPFPR
jgi:hypothetical protein